ncbi:hypothetical protein ACF1DV_17470 [Streptomyces achromogenes]|uniref:hypothetical protein n=1 Tax=Streptomyces achromogenes TaxID=67255 RepID=UPI0036F7CE63
MKLWADAHTQAGKGPAWFRTDKPSAKEHESAAGCKLDTGYVKAVHAVEVRAQKAAIDKTKKALEDRQAAHERPQGHRRSLLTSGCGTALAVPGAAPAVLVLPWPAPRRLARTPRLLTSDPRPWARPAPPGPIPRLLAAVPDGTAPAGASRKPVVGADPGRGDSTACS